MSCGCDFFCQVAAVVESVGVHHQPSTVSLYLYSLNSPIVVMVQRIRQPQNSTQSECLLKLSAMYATSLGGRYPVPITAMQACH